MPDEQLAGQETPVVDNKAPEAVADNAAPASTEPVDAGTKEEQVTKTFTQKDVDEIVKRAKAATESKTERRILRTLQQLQGQQQPTQPQETQPESVRYSGETEEAYLERLVEEKLQKRTQAEAMRGVYQKTEDYYAKAEKTAGFDREVFDSLPITPAIAQTIVDSDPDTAPKLMAYLCENPGEAERLSKLSAARQAAELGKLEDRLSAPKATAKPPKAPAPIDPIGNGKAPVTDLSRMSAEEYYAQRMKQRPAWTRR
jgi:hypothetical protein